ncbi:MAG: hypothetical protein ACI8Q1_001331 [Parvicella sp.]|jgi:hypothetical protein
MNKLNLISFFTLLSFVSFGQKNFNQQYTIIQDSTFEGNGQFYGNFSYGLFHKKQEEIIIPKKYISITMVNNFLVCKSPSDYFQFSYDIYSWSEKGVVLINQNISSYQTFPLAIFHPDKKEKDELILDVDSLYYIYRSGDQMGLYYLDLFERELHNVEVFDNKHTFVSSFGSDHMAAIGIKNGEIFYKEIPENKKYHDDKSFELFSITGNNSFHRRTDENGYRHFIADGQYYHSRYDTLGKLHYFPKRSSMQEIEYGIPHSGDGIQILENDKIYIQVNNVGVEFEHFDDEGDPMYDNDGFPIFGEEEGIFKSGVYDLKSEEWIINRDYSFVQKGYLGYLLETPSFDESKLEHNYTYSFLNTDGSYAFNNITTQQLLARTDADQYTMPKYKVDSITDFLDIKKVWSDGQSHYCYDGDFFYILLPNYPDFKTGIITSEDEYGHEFPRFYSIANQQLFLEYERELLSYQLEGDILLFDLTASNYDEDAYVSSSQLFLKNKDYLIELIYKDSLTIDTIPNHHLDSLIQKANNIYIKSVEESLLSFTSEFSYEEMDYETGESLYDSEGDIVMDLHASSGIYDYKKKVWIAEPVYKRVFEIGDYFLLWQPKRTNFIYDEEGSLQSVTITNKERFIIINKQGGFIASANELMDLPIDYLKNISEKDQYPLNLTDIEIMQIKYDLVSYVKDENLGGDGVFYGKSKDNKWGMYQTYVRGEIIPAQYDSISEMGWNTPFTIVWNNNKAGIYTDVFGTPALSIPCSYENAVRGYSNGVYYLAAQRNGKWGYVDWNNGKVLLDFTYEEKDLPSPDLYISSYYSN